MCMIIATIIMVTGPFTNFIMPIMIGAKDMAFPRLNAMSFWVVVSAVPPLLATFFLGGVDAGWTTYAPLSVQAPAAMDAFCMTIIVFVISVTVSGVNTIVTIFTMRAKGMTLGRLPIFTWASLIGAALSIYAMPALLIAFVTMITDRVTGTSFFVAAQGGTGWLWENAFWIFGHPEVYIILIPPVGAMLEVASTFARKPLFGYKVTVAAFVAISALSIMVWAHHMFTTGWAPALAGPFMVTTEIISIPTGIIFLCLIGTIWKGQNLDPITDVLRLPVPVELHHRRGDGDLPLRHAGGQVLPRRHVRHRALPLHAARRGDDRRHRGPVLLVPESHRQNAQRTDREDVVLDDRPRDPGHLLRHVLGGVRGDAASRRLLRSDLPARQRHGDGRGVSADARVGRPPLRRDQLVAQRT